MSVAWGMDRDEALKALTVNAAEILGVADRVGSLEPGKDANLFIAKGDPLEVESQVTHVFIQGKDVGLDNKHWPLPEVHRQAVETFVGRNFSSRIARSRGFASSTELRE